MKKHVLDLQVVEVSHPHPRYVLIRLTRPDGPLPAMQPGQFAQLRVDGSPSTFLRRPISIHYVDPITNEVWFLVQIVGDGTRQLSRLQPGSTLNAILPLGHGFTMPQRSEERILLVGGGVGCAPLLFMGKAMSEAGCRPTFLIGARTQSDLIQLSLFAQYGDVYVTTEDGSYGERGFVTQHSLLTSDTAFDRISACGPKPMMMAVACYAKQAGVPCEVSLENKMACGVGACLCCVEDTQSGHQCVCTEGPVFPVEQLRWPL